MTSKYAKPASRAIHPIDDRIFEAGTTAAWFLYAAFLHYVNER